MIRTRTIAVAAALIASLLAPGGAAAGDRYAAEDYPKGLLFSAGAGMGMEYSWLGGGLEVEARHKSGAAIALDLGLGSVATVGVDLWSPGRRVRFGAGVTKSRDWDSVIQYVCGESGGGCMDYQSDNGAWAYGARVAADHDIGRPGRWGLRYGLGGVLVVSGCAGGFLPEPVLAAHYTF